jgi:hypothetical protein
VKHRISVTRRHIRTGVAQDASACALAVALTEQYGGRWVVGPKYAERGLRRWRLDADARKIPQKFDARQHIKPQTVTMTGPALGRPRGLKLRLPRGGHLLDATGRLTSAGTIGELAEAAIVLLAMLTWRLTVVLFRLTLLLFRGVAALVRFGLAVRADLLAEAAAERAARPAAETAVEPVTETAVAPAAELELESEPVAEVAPTPVPAGAIPASATYVLDPADQAPDSVPASAEH